MICIGCHRTPDEIQDIRIEAAGLGMTPEEWVREEEGTFNESNGHFACDDCYIEMGMPAVDARVGRWVAP